MSDEAAEIIPRPPSSPIGSTLLIVGTLGLILSIAIVWSELYGEYLPAGPPDAEMGKHGSMTIAQQKVRDHFAADFPNGETLASVEADLQLSSTIGDLNPPGAGGGGGSSESPEAPSEGGGGN